MSDSKRPFIPALNQEWLSPLYDPILRWVMHEDIFKGRLIELAYPKASEQVLDLGCGTGTLTLMIHKFQPRAVITGLDADEKVLSIARRKAADKNVSGITWDQGLATDLSYPDGAFDLVISSLVLHHLTGPGKRQAFREVRRVLKPGGRFFIIDFGYPHDGLMRLIARVMSLLEETKENFKGLIPGFLKEAGFSQVVELAHYRDVFGPLSIYQAINEISSTKIH